MKTYLFRWIVALATIAYTSAALGREGEEIAVAAKASDVRTFDNLDVMVMLSGGSKFYVPAPKEDTEVRKAFNRRTDETKQQFLEKREEVLKTFAGALSSEKLGYRINLLVQGAIATKVKIAPENKNPLTELAENSEGSGSLNAKRYQMIQSLLQSLDDNLWSDVTTKAFMNTNEFGCAFLVHVGAGIGTITKTKGKSTGILISYAYNFEKKTLIFDILRDIRSIEDANTVLFNAAFIVKGFTYQGVRHDDEDRPVILNHNSIRTFLNFQITIPYLPKIRIADDRIIKQMHIYNTKLYPAFAVITKWSQDFFNEVKLLTRKALDFVTRRKSSPLMCSSIFEF